MRRFRKINCTDSSTTIDDDERTSRKSLRSFLRSSRRNSPSPNLARSNEHKKNEIPGVQTTAHELGSHEFAPSPFIRADDTTPRCAPGANLPASAQLLRSSVSQRASAEDFVLGNDMWHSAFRQACALRPDEERQKLKQSTHVQELFERLQTEDKKHMETSRFQKGVDMLGPILNGLNFLITLSDPVSSIGPSAASALAIVKMVTAIGIAMCGAAQEMHSSIETFFMHLPRIDFCDAIQMGRPKPNSARERSKPDIVNQALVCVYGDLLDFFFHGCRLLKSKHYFLASVKSHMHSKIASIVDSFVHHIGVLDNCIVAATKEIVNRLAENDINREVREILQADSTKEIELYNTLTSRANNACEWIKSHAEFQRWLQAALDPKHITLCGDMGCGKTFTVAYIVDYLRSDPHGTTQPLVCSYFCKGDGEMNQAKNVFRSLLSQLLAAKVSLRWHFIEWHRRRQGTIQIDPTQSVKDLSNILVELITSVRQALYVVVDGLDECDDRSRAHLLDFFTQITPTRSTQVHKHAGLVRILTSSRPGTAHSLTPEGTSMIQIHNSTHRDRQIVSHLASQYMMEVEAPARNFIIEEISSKMQGCAIWGRLLLEYLQRSEMTKVGSIKRLLQDLPPPGELSDLYIKLFEKAVEKFPDNRWILARSLDMLAAARRQLTLRELVYAVSIETAPSEFVTSLGEMTETTVDCKRVFRLIKPFISVDAKSSESGVPENAFLRLVHHSLRELITSQPPYEWQTLSGRMRQTPKSFRSAELNGLALRLCMKYLLLDEFGTLELVPDTSEQDYANDLSDMLRINDDQESVNNVENSNDFDPHSRGFGGFYTYAACYWTIHYESVSEEYMPDVEDLIALSQPGSIRMKNWLDRMRQPDWRVDLERNPRRGYNPLALVAWFGSETALEGLLNKGSSSLGLADKELRTSAVELAATQAIQHHKFDVVEVLLKHPTTTSDLRDMFLLENMAVQWSSLKAPSIQRWERLLDLMLKHFEEQLTHYANYILLRASRIGCLPGIKKLFEMSVTNKSVRENLSERTSDQWGPIGQAGAFGYADIVSYICEQTGMEAHLYHQDPSGDNIYHCIARNGNPNSLRVLVRYFPEGVNQAAGGGTTPLQVAVNHAQSLEAVEVLLLEGKADIHAGNPYFMPLRCAVRNGHIEMCRLLIVCGGADPWTVVGISDIGIPFLHEHVQAPSDYALQVEQDVLREICSLMPLTVSWSPLPSSNLST